MPLTRGTLSGGHEPLGLGEQLVRARRAEPIGDLLADRPDRFARTAARADRGSTAIRRASRRRRSGSASRPRRPSRAHRPACCRWPPGAGPRRVPPSGTSRVSVSRRPASAAAASSSPPRVSTARHPWPGGGHERGRVERPSLVAALRAGRGPPAASTSASKSPSASRRSRVSTLPRTSRTSRSGRAASSSARRRRLDVPTTAPSARSSRLAAPQIASRGSARSRHADDRSRPSGKLRRHVLRRVHGQVDVARAAAPPRSP